MASNTKKFKLNYELRDCNGNICKNPNVQIDDATALANGVSINCAPKNGKIEGSYYVEDDRDLSGVCIPVSLQCEDCVGEILHTEICLCANNSDCGECQNCIGGLCEDICPDKECVNDKCVDCADDLDCPENQICDGNGNCVCPQGTFLGEDGRTCVHCNENTDLEPCEICVEGEIIVKDCADGYCNPITGECDSCLNAGNCGENQICVDGECECAPGYVKDLSTGECVLAPECVFDGDCGGSCDTCVNNNCVSSCPSGTVCDGNGNCIPECDCESGPCDDTRACVPVEGGKCGCIDCATLSCSEEGTAGGCQSGSDKYCYCDNEGDCAPNPCKDVTCNNGLDCGEGCGCLNGQCIPCDSLACAGAFSCGDALGCTCDSGSCTDDPDPCSNYSCDETTGAAACTGGSDSRPDCGCDGNGDCVQQPCEGEFTLEKDDAECRLVATLETNKCCDCPDYTVDNKLVTVSSDGFTYTVDSLFEVRKGDTSVVGGIDTLSLVDDVSKSDILYNEEPLSGRVDVYVIYTLRTTNPATGEVTITTDTVKVEEIKIGDAADYPHNYEIQTINSTNYGPTTEITDIRLEYRLAANINFPNNCTYPAEYILFSYNVIDGEFETALQADQDFWRKRLLNKSAGQCAYPTFRWVKALRGTNDYTDFRELYVAPTNGVYTDYIDNPKENPFGGLEGNTSDDNHGELWSGYKYRVYTDCGCETEAVLEECNGVLVFCNPDNTPNIEFTSCNSIKFLETWRTDCPVNYDYSDTSIPEDAKLQYGIYVNGSNVAIGDSLKSADDPTGNVYEIDDEFQWNETIRYIELKWDHDVCDQCTITIENPNPVERDFIAEITCAPLANGTTEFTIAVDFTLPENQDVISATLNIGGIVLTPTNATATFVAEPSANITATVLYENCDTPYEEVLNLPEDCCDGVDVVIENFGIDCDTTAVSIVATSVPSGLSGNYVYVVSGNGETTTTENPTNALTIDLETFGNSPQVTVTFTPDNGCDAVTKTEILNISDQAIAQRIEPTSDSVVLCGTVVGQVTYDIPAGYSGTVTYTACGVTTTVTLNDGDDLIIPITGAAGGSCDVTIDNNNLIPVSGQGCPCVFEDITTTFEFVTDPSLTFNTDPTTVCQGEVVTVNYTTDTAGILTYNYNGTAQQSLVQGVGTFTLPTNVAGTFTFQPTSFEFGEGCIKELVGLYSATITVNEQDTLTVTPIDITGDDNTCSVELQAVSNNTITFNPTFTSQNGNIYTWANQPTGTVIQIDTDGVCPESELYTINCACPTIVAPSTTATNVSYCQGSGPVSITAAPSTGNTILWSTGAVTNTIQVSAGTYTAYSVDSNGCQSEGLDFTVIENANPVVSSVTLNDLCADGDTLTWNITATVPAGLSNALIEVGGQTVNASTLTGNQTVNLAVGTYTANITITDNNGCTASTTAPLIVTDCCDCAVTVTADCTNGITVTQTGGDCEGYNVEIVSAPGNTTTGLTDTFSTPSETYNIVEVNGIYNVKVSKISDPSCVAIDTNIEVTDCCTCEITNVTSDPTNCETLIVTTSGNCGGYNNIEIKDDGDVTVFTGAYNGSTTYTVPAGTYGNVTLSGDADCPNVVSTVSGVVVDGCCEVTPSYSGTGSLTFSLSEEGAIDQDVGFNLNCPTCCSNLVADIYVEILNSTGTIILSELNVLQSSVSCGQNIDKTYTGNAFCERISEEMVDGNTYTYRTRIVVSSNSCGVPLGTEYILNQSFVYNSTIMLPFPCTP